jgi:hypothetical protein
LQNPSRLLNLHRYMLVEKPIWKCHKEATENNIRDAAKIGRWWLAVGADRKRGNFRPFKKCRFWEGFFEKIGPLCVKPYSYYDHLNKGVISHWRAVSNSLNCRHFIFMNRNTRACNKLILWLFF